MKKIERTEYVSQMIKSSYNSKIGLPTSGWIVGENGEFQIDYFTGNPFPESVANFPVECQNEDTENEEESCSSDDEFDDGEDTDDEWTPK